MKKVLCFGEVLIDFLPDEDDGTSFKPIAGGAPANVAVAIAKLGGESFFVGGIGSDNFGRFLQKQLAAYRVNTDYLCSFENSNSALVLVSLDDNKERSFNFYRHDTADMRFRREDFQEESFRQADIFHYCSNTLTTEELTQTTLAGLKLAKQHGLLVSLDVNLRLTLWSEASVLSSRLLECLPHTDLIKFSREELVYLSEQVGKSADELVAYCLATGPSLVVVTDGGNEISVHTREYRVIHQAPVITPVDTTAAGDAFVGGLLYQLAENNIGVQEFHDLLLQQAAVEKMIGFATKCGAVTCTRKGAFPALPGRGDIQG
ncbi:carbohydrate kinase [Thalassomonas viridans]|uniref:Carbohydrate kinase n=1 Tax=Thalassomonas viridans TaxID=137584 RepID=A0AAE9Z336_9GAMM|nr:carbohydrate kinase [Thalassomonas viridans]WDE05906.1 carbohydrate kinase [Thalassomonas viridans]